MLPLPFALSAPITPASPPSAHAARLLTSSPSSKSPLFLVSTPTDRTTAAAAGSTVWAFHMKPWGEQVNELVEAGSYSDALALLESIDEALLSDKVRARITIIQKRKLKEVPPSVGSEDTECPWPTRCFPIPIWAIHRRNQLLHCA